MKALKYGFGLILVGGFALTASCGGSSDDSSSPSGGTSSSTGGTSSSTAGTIGNTTGGTIGNTTGGTIGNTTGGTIGNPTGGTGNPTGGTGNPAGGTGNPAGGAGGGGMTMNPAACPATAPAIPAQGMMGEACMALPRGTACTYAMGDMTERCTCNVARGGPGGGQAGAASTDGTFRCTMMATPIMCSATPATGDACSGIGCRLPNMGGFCTCMNAKLDCTPRMGAAGAGG